MQKTRPLAHHKIPPHGLTTLVHAAEFFACGAVHALVYRAHTTSITNAQTAINQRTAPP